MREKEKVQKENVNMRPKRLAVWSSTEWRNFFRPWVLVPWIFSLSLFSSFSPLILLLLLTLGYVKKGSRNFQLLSELQVLGLLGLAQDLGQVLHSIAPQALFFPSAPYFFFAHVAPL